MCLGKWLAGVNERHQFGKAKIIQQHRERFNYIIDHQRSRDFVSVKKKIGITKNPYLFME